MRICEVHSHLNGLEYMLIRKPVLWEEIGDVVSRVSLFPRVDAHPNRKAFAKMQAASSLVTKQFVKLFREKKWRRHRGYINTDSFSVRSRELVLESQDSVGDAEFESDALKLRSIQTDFVKERVAIEVQFGKYSFVAYDLFVKHLAFYVGDQIDVGIEILPMKKLQSQMSSGVPYYEGEFYNVIRQGRGVPAVPLVIVGIEP